VGGQPLYFSDLGTSCKFKGAWKDYILCNASSLSKAYMIFTLMWTIPINYLSWLTWSIELCSITHYSVFFFSFISYWKFGEILKKRKISQIYTILSFKSQFLCWKIVKFHPQKNHYCMVAGAGASMCMLCFLFLSGGLGKRGGGNVARVEVLKKNKSILRFVVINPWWKQN